MAIIGSLGEVVFQVSNKNRFGGKGLGAFGRLLNKLTGNTGITYKTPSNYTRQAEARWETHDIIGQKPVSEFVGPGLESVSFDLKLDADLGVDPEEELEKLRKMRDTGEKVFLILGGYPVFGNNNRVYITSLEENLLRTNGKGKAMAIDVSINLQEYVMRPEEMEMSQSNETDTSQSS